jgi:type II secretory pathway pseudopilin PulG
VDLVLAVAFLGALAAVAVPRQQDLTTRNRLTEVRSLAGSLRSAAQLGHSLWLAQGEPASIETRGGRVRIVNGYPAAADLARLLEAPETMAFMHEGGAWRHRDDRGDAFCGVGYATPATPSGSPSIRLRITGC